MISPKRWHASFLNSAGSGSLRISSRNWSRRACISRRSRSSIGHHRGTHQCASANVTKVCRVPHTATNFLCPGRYGGRPATGTHQRRFVWLPTKRAQLVDSPRPCPIQSTRGKLGLRTRPKSNTAPQPVFPPQRKWRSDSTAQVCPVSHGGLGVRWKPGGTGFVHRIGSGARSYDAGH